MAYSFKAKSLKSQEGYYPQPPTTSKTGGDCLLDVSFLNVVSAANVKCADEASPSIEATFSWNRAISALALANPTLSCSL